MNRERPHEQASVYRQVFRFNLVSTLCIAVVVGALVWHGLSVSLYNQNLAELRSAIKLVAELGLGNMRPDDDTLATSRDLIAKINGNGKYSITMALSDGTLLGDLDRYENAGLFATRHEVAVARRDGEGISRRYNDRHGRTMLYLARKFPVDGGADNAIMRISIPVSSLDNFSKSDLMVMGLFFIGLVGFAVFISYAIAMRTSVPASELEQGLLALGGDSKVKRVSLSGSTHLNVLATALNSTADRLERRISDLENTRKFATMVISNIPSGIITFDSNLNVTMYNEAAAKMMGFSPPFPAPNLSTAKIQNLELITILYDTMKSNEPVRGEIRQRGPGNMVFDVFSTHMTDAGGSSAGVLLLLTDMTTLRRLETVRQDFVGNVAHELRTPVTSISGFAGLLEHSSSVDQEKITKYASIIARQAKHMETIINDLLTLSGLDHADEMFINNRADASIAQTIGNAVELCNERIKENGVELAVECSPELHAPIHQALMEQALVNLIENAVKYGVTEKSKLVSVSAAKMADGTIEIKVADHGNGIPAEQQGRIFERFYRIDRGRSREQGGTGLGLAIVKHIMRMHNGNVTVESRRGETTCFTLKFPA